MPINFNQSPIGIPFENMYDLEKVQDPTYWTGNGLGWLPESVIAELLQNASVDKTMKGSSTIGLRQRFERVDYIVTHWWHGVIAGILQAVQGRFQFELTPAPNNELRISIPWKLEILPGVTTTQNDIIALANLGIKDY